MIFTLEISSIHTKNISFFIHKNLINRKSTQRKSSRHLKSDIDGLGEVCQTWIFLAPIVVTRKDLCFHRIGDLVLKWWELGASQHRKEFQGFQCQQLDEKKTLQLRMSIDKISSNRVFKQDCQNGGCQMVTCSTGSFLSAFAVANQLSQVSSIPSTTTASMLVT